MSRAQKTILAIAFAVLAMICPLVVAALSFRFWIAKEADIARHVSREKVDAIREANREAIRREFREFDSFVDDIRTNTSRR